MMAKINAGLLILAVIVLVLSSCIASAASFSASEQVSKGNYNYDTWTYKQYKHGSTKGFVLTHTWNSPSYSYSSSFNSNAYNSKNPGVNWNSYLSNAGNGNSYSAVKDALNVYSKKSKSYASYAGHVGYRTNYW